MKNNLNWLESIGKKLPVFLRRLNINGDYTAFRYSYFGDLLRENTKWGLGQAVFISKLLYMTSTLEKIKKGYINNLDRFIQSFQSKDGIFTDENLFFEKKSLLFINYKKLKINKFRYENIKIAETRQSIAGLKCLSKKPKYKLLRIPSNKRELKEYLDKFPWDKPWHTGSHFSHLIFFLNYNGNRTNNNFKLIKYAIKYINKYKSKKDGTWHKGLVSNKEKINGAMKILTGLVLTKDFSVEYPEKIIDLCLSSIPRNDACNSFNIIYVLYICQKFTNYRTREIEDFCLHLLEEYRKHYYPKLGGFSFYKNKANDMYYGVKISKGLNEPDIHGTLMYIWGIALISKILKLNMNLKPPIN